MARRRNSNSGGGGIIVLALVIGIAAYAGIALLVIAAVGGIIYLIGKAISSSSASGNASSGHDAPQTRSTNETSLPVSANSSAVSTAVRANKTTEEIRTIMRKYQLDACPFPSTQVDPLQKEMSSYQCIEVLQSVNRLLGERTDSIKRLNELKAEIDQILTCPNCDGEKERLKYLRENDSLLQKKLDEHRTIMSGMRSNKVSLLNKHNLAFSNIKSAIQQIISCKKISSRSGVDFGSFITLNSTLPGDMFSTPTSPIEMNFGAYRFFLLPEVILAFDKKGLFVTAFEPIAMIITSRDLQKDVYVSKTGYSGSWSFYDSLISDDSVKVSEGIPRTSWLHEKKNGGPDLRYSNNPMTQRRTDVYRYGEVSFQMGQYKAEYSFSSGSIAAKVKSLVRDYTAIIHTPNAAPSFLRLLERTCKKKELAKELSNNYERMNDNIICKVG